LTYPGLNVKVTPEKKGKFLTSEFAKKHNCIIAINGEAGESISMDCELVKCSGNWVSKGKPVLMSDSEKRPFMAFDENSKGRYYEEIFVDTVYNDNYYNTLWGRFDILKEGQIIPAKRYRPYARTVMGLNTEGTYHLLNGCRW